MEELTHGDLEALAQTRGIDVRWGTSFIYETDPETTHEVIILLPRNGYTDLLTLDINSESFWKRIFLIW